jgi:hypothetical protein
MVWPRHVARINRGNRHALFLMEDMKERDHLEYLGLGGKVALKWALKILVGAAWTRFMWHRIGMMAGSCEHGNELF